MRKKQGGPCHIHPLNRQRSVGLQQRFRTWVAISQATAKKFMVGRLGVRCEAQNLVAEIPWRSAVRKAQRVRRERVRGARGSGKERCAQRGTNCLRAARFCVRARGLSPRFARSLSSLALLLKKRAVERTPFAPFPLTHQLVLASTVLRPHHDTWLHDWRRDRCGADVAFFFRRASKCVPPIARAPLLGAWAEFLPIHPRQWPGLAFCRP